jgi:uncharacterized damage-inducible protein DinB
MTTQELMQQFYASHKELIDYVAALSQDKFVYSANGKWTPGQQLAHIHLCLLPISQALSSKEFIKTKFGSIDRTTMSYDETVNTYTGGLTAGGKAPDRFLPGKVTIEQKENIIADLYTLLATISKQVQEYTDEELDTLVLPHPFLGKLTIREMLSLMTYHATHHLEQTKRNLMIQE